MTMQRRLRLALIAVLCATAPGLAAQPVDPAAAPETTEAEVTEAASDLPTVADAGEVDRRCLKYTGSRITADATPRTDRDRSVHERRKCANATGTVYTRDDIERSGEIDLKSALRTLDPRIQ